MQNTMDFKLNYEENVVNLADWKAKNIISKKEESIKNYLSVLNFNELTTESNNVISELRSNPINHDLIVRSKLLLEEFNNRLDMNGTSSDFSKSLQKLRNITRETISKLGKLQEL